MIDAQLSTVETPPAPVIELLDPSPTVVPLGPTARRFRETEQLLRRFVILPDDNAYVLATLWILHTHVRDQDGRFAFDHTMRLAYLSNGPASGKTVALKITSRLSANPLLCGYITSAGLVKLISELNMTPFLDEIDLLFGTSHASKRDLRAVVNSGYEREGKIVRAGKIDLTFGPVALGGLMHNFLFNPVYEPTRTRSVAIIMRPKQDHETVETFRYRKHGKEFADQARTLAKWGERWCNALVEMDPEMPEGVSNRDVDLWAPLLAIADHADPETSDRARAAVRQYVLGVSEHEHETDADRMITAMLSIFRAHGDPVALPTTMITAGLADDPTTAHMLGGNERAAQMAVANLLRPLAIRSHVFGADGEQTRGYRRADVAAYGPDDLTTLRPYDLTTEVTA